MTRHDAWTVTLLLLCGIGGSTRSQAQTEPEAGDEPLDSESVVPVVLSAPCEPPEDLNLAALCGDDERQLQASNDAQDAFYVIREDGRLDIEEDAERNHIRVLRRGPRMYLRVEVRGTSEDETVACFRVEHDKAYRLPRPPQATARSVLSVTLFDAPIGDIEERGWREVREERLEQIEDTRAEGRARLEEQAAILDLPRSDPRPRVGPRIDLLPGYMPENLGPHQHGPVLAAVRSFIQDPAAAKAAVAAARQRGIGRWNQLRCDSDLGLRQNWRGRCAQVTELTQALARLGRVMEVDEVNPAHLTASSQTLSASTQAIYRSVREATLMRAWYLGRAYARRISTHELPSHLVEQIRSVVYDAGEEMQQDLADDVPTSLVVTDVPVSAQLAVLKKRTDRSQTTASPQLAAIARFAALVVPVVAALRAGQPNPCQAMAIADSQVKPLLRRGARSFALGRLDDEHVLTAYVCAGASCKVEGSDENVRNLVRLETSRPIWRGITLLVEFAANFGPDESFGKPTYAPIGPQVGPDQVYELSYPDGRSNIFTVAVLLGARLGRFLIGTGPALNLDSDSGVRLQWDVRLGFELIGGLYLTGGVGIRSVEQARDVPLGHRVVSPTEPPSPVYEASPRLVGAIGLALDLQAIGSALDGLLKSLGGGS